MFDREPIPLERQRKYKGELTLLCQMLAGCATSTAAFLASDLSDLDVGSHFLRRFYDWMAEYLDHKALSFAEVRKSKYVRLGLLSAQAV